VVAVAAGAATVSLEGVTDAVFVVVVFATVFFATELIYKSIRVYL
jgi:hypothetical protein